MKGFLEGFREPPNECRAMPFWFWNSKMGKEEIVSQIHAFQRMGLGGFFIHARFGLETTYLSGDWFDAVEAAVLEAESLGLDVWLYDENLFPSGIGDTAVSRQERYRPKFIEYGIFELARDGEGWYVPLEALPGGCEPFSAQAVSDAEQRILAFHVAQGKIRLSDEDMNFAVLFWINTIQSPDGRVFGVDYLNPDTLCAFIESTHEAYRKRLGNWFGTVIKGFFTDEPALLPWHHDMNWYKGRGNGRCVPYTPRLLEEMERDGVSGMDLGRLAGALFFDCGNPESTGQLRKAYWKAVSRLYEENFFKAYAAWCEKNSLMLTGHVLLEEGLYFNHIFQAGPLSGLAHMHMPGVDQLGAGAESASMSYMVEDLPHIPRVKTNVTGPKLVSSIAHTAGRRRVISESFGVGGWGLQFRRMKAILDWLYVLGVNRLCPHAFFYSIEGFRKSDAPPCHFHNADAAMYTQFADYAARLSWALSQGEPEADTAVLYPESAFRLCYAVGRQRERDRLVSDTYDLVCAGLLNVHRSYEIITESRLAAAELAEGKLVLPENPESGSISGVACGMGGLRFSTVVVPSLAGMETEAAKLLERFAASGGRLLAFNEHGESALSTGGKAVMGVPPAPRMTRLGMRRILSGFFRGECSGGMRLSGEGNERVYALCRNIEGNRLWLLVNTDAERSFQGRISFGGCGISFLDAETGSLSGNTGSEAELSLAPAGSALLLVSGEAGIGANGYGNRAKKYADEMEIDPRAWAFQTNGLNALPVNRWNLTMARRGMNIEYTYRAAVYSEVAVGGDLFIVLDDIAFRSSVMGRNDVAVAFNGHHCEPAGWHADPGFKKFRAVDLRVGKSLLEITIRAAAWSGKPHTLTSNAVLLGRFGLEKRRGGFRIVSEPVKMNLGPWDGQGYPFYSGQASYTKKIALPADNSWVLELDGAEGCVQLSVDGDDLGTRLWPPWRWELPDGKAGKEAELRLSVTNTLANYLGERCPSGPRGPMRLRHCV